MRAEDTLRILIATDNHLGYAEKNPSRADDSFNTFEEILQIAKTSKVDMVLLGGDLFHENKPSRSAEKRCVDILRKYVLGDEPIQIELVSDPEIDFAHCQFKRVNFEDQDINVGLPIFSIHGNHDDPSGLGGLSCLDTLHSIGLINYFGKIDDLKNVKISPLLIQKGETRLALYGLSSLKDERLHKLFLRNQVQMMRPKDDLEDWFNLFVLHQNRAKHGPTSYIPEHFIDGFINLVLWGHEHECRIEPEAIVHGNKELFVTQPGSSVATSLCEGEAKPKKVGLLSIYKDKFKMEPIELQTVRPMIFRSIALDESSLDLGRHITEKQIRQKVENYLQSYVEEMLIDADGLRTGHPMQPQLPLLRLRVEYSDDAHQLTPGRFGNLFHDRVANPSDILLFRKKIDRSTMGTKFHTSDFEIEGTILEGTSMKDFVSQYFDEMAADERKQLKLLGIRGIAAAVENFIEKDQKDSISLIVEKQLNKTYETLLRRQEDENCSNDIDDMLEELRLARSSSSIAKNVNEEEDREAMRILEEATSADNDPVNDVMDLEQEVEAMEEIELETTTTKRGRGRGRGRGSRSNISTRGRSSRKAPVAQTSTSSIKEAFTRQSQRTLSKSRSKAAMYIDTDESD